MAKTHGDVLKAKQKRQKVIAAAGAVILLALLAVQVPKVMKHMHNQAPVSSGYAHTTTTATPAAPSPATPSPSSSLATASAAPVADGQLASFSRFASKDPFEPQLKDTSAANDDNTNPGTSSSGAGGSSDESGSSGETGSTTETSGSGSESGSGSGSGSDSSTSADAVISVNGTLMLVAVGTDFPQPSSSNPDAVPLFHLVSHTATSARISIVGGSYSSGAPTVTLKVNKPVTLMNTADGTRYKLVLKPLGTRVPASG